MNPLASSSLVRSGAVGLMTLVLAALGSIGCSEPDSPPGSGLVPPESTSLRPVGSSAPHVQYFGYYDNGCGSTLPTDELVQGQRTHSNITMMVCLRENRATGQVEDVFQRLPAAAASGMKMVLIVSERETVGTYPNQRYVLHWLGDRPAAWQSAVDLIRPYIDNVAAFAVADEFDCGEPQQPGNPWTPDECVGARLRLESITATLKESFPNTPTWVNYTSAFFYGFRRNNPEAASYRVPSNADWVSMDCYTPYETCYGGGNTVDVLLDDVERTLAPHQRVVLLPQAFQGAYLGYDLSPTSVVSIAQQYYERSQRDPRVVAIVPFIWRDAGHLVGARTIPTIRAKYQDMGRRIIVRTRPVGDFDGDGRTDIAVYRPSDGWWHVRGQYSVPWGATGDIPMPGDFNGDSRTDVAVYRPSEGWWHVRGQYSVAWGALGDVPVPGDYDADGRADVAVYRPSDGWWHVRGQYSVQWGVENDVPMPGDYDRDGRTDVAVYRPSDGSWHVRGQYSVQWGAENDVPMPGDYDGDGRTDVAVYRPSDGSWHVKGQFSVQWGAEGDIPVAGDFDGDGRTDVAVYRPSEGWWHVRGQYSVAWGATGDVPVTTQPTR